MPEEGWIWQDETMTPTLNPPRLTLRPLVPGDADAVFAMMGDDETMRWWDWPAFQDRAVVSDIVASQLADVTEGVAVYWAVVLNASGAVVGSCDLSEIDNHHARAEVGFLFHRSHWGNGYAREAMQAVIVFAFEDLRLQRLWARIHAGNAASRRLLERLGFSREGTLKGHVLRDGARRDCEIYARMR